MEDDYYIIFFYYGIEISIYIHDIHVHVVSIGNSVLGIIWRLTVVTMSAAREYVKKRYSKSVFFLIKKNESELKTNQFQLSLELYFAENPIKIELTVRKILSFSACSKQCNTNRIENYYWLYL